ncbi:Crp/Fnr family transcriptional regulator [Novosphingobium sp. 9U]|uniref:Crp/Fnr family transcriptional regulator n=1 Tax=Novosphingobium sp. 9U TaxID=2653158 RepID=UPI0012F04D67|nr:Crp/Fnr family transcriptional regulator [Novosphingobium sp. 9U]VWX50761.1 Crp/Fnr family transcriptional regulator [Novosphingobium sp. 9U]
MDHNVGLRDTTNWLLLSLVDQDWWRVAPFLEREVLQPRRYIERTGLKSSKVYFIETGVISRLETGDLREPIEVGVVGREGMIGVASMAHLLPQLDSYVQIEARALAMDAEHFQSTVRAIPAVRTLVSHYVQSQAAQFSLAASAGVRASVQQRLARQLLMFHDRTGDDDLSLTHEGMSLMLGVRRASVTTCIHNMEGEGLIRARRGFITIRARAALEEYCGCFYGVAEARYFAIMGEAVEKAATQQTYARLSARLGSQHQLGIRNNAP